MSDTSPNALITPELEALIERLIDEKLRLREDALNLHPPQQSLSELLSAIRENIWTPPPDAPSTKELLRKDRDGLNPL